MEIGWMQTVKEMTEGHRRREGSAVLDPPSLPRAKMLQGRSDKLPVCGSDPGFRNRSNCGPSDRGSRGSCNWIEVSSRECIEEGGFT